MPASIVATALLLLLAAGCGSAGSPRVASVASGTSAVSASVGGGSGATGLVAYAACMRSHGVPRFPDPASSGALPKEAVVSTLQAVSSAQAEAAQNACEHLLPVGGSLSGQAVQPVPDADRQDYLEAAACMRSHGFPNFPDPTFPNGSVQTNIPSSIDQDSSRFTSAARICTKLIPSGLRDSGSGAR